VSRILVTGGAGFIGSHVVDHFLAADAHVTVVDDLSNGKRENVPDAATFYRLSICDPELRSIVSAGAFDVIVHLAAQIDVRRSVDDPLVDADTNIIGMLNLLEGVRRGATDKPRVVFSSTGGAIYGAAPTPTPETAAKNPHAPYGIAKLSAEYYLAYYSRVWGIDTAVARFGNVYGPRQNPHGDAGVIAIFANRLLEGKPLRVFGTGQQTRDYVFVGDVARAIVLLSTAKLPEPTDLDQRAFNIGTGVSTSVIDLATTLGLAGGWNPRIEFAQPRPGELEESRLDTTKATELLSWCANTSLQRGLKATVDWFRVAESETRRPN
jgi:UDP-glucose 4-epimerase